jgi:plasmid stabilization system protein ParE
MAYKVKTTESADRDTDEILVYIAETLANPKAAADFAGALEERYTALEDHPLMFELSRSERLARMGYRRFVVGNYVALYLVNEERQEVTVARIFYGRRNYDKYI